METKAQSEAQLAKERQAAHKIQTAFHQKQGAVTPPKADVDAMAEWKPGMKPNKKWLQDHAAGIRAELLRVIQSGQKYKTEAVVDDATRAGEVLVMYDNIPYKGYTFHVHYHVTVTPGGGKVSMNNGAGHIICANIGNGVQRDGHIEYPNSKIGEPGPRLTTQLNPTALAKAKVEGMLKEPASRDFWRQKFVEGHNDKMAAEKVKAEKASKVTTSGGASGSGSKKSKKGGAPQKSEAELEKEYLEKTYGPLSKMTKKKGTILFNGKPFKMKDGDYEKLSKYVKARTGYDDYYLGYAAFDDFGGYYDQYIDDGDQYAAGGMYAPEVADNGYYGPSDFQYVAPKNGYDSLYVVGMMAGVMMLFCMICVVVNAVIGVTCFAFGRHVGRDWRKQEMEEIEEV